MTIKTQFSRFAWRAGAVALVGAAGFVARASEEAGAAGEGGHEAAGGLLGTLGIHPLTVASQFFAFIILLILFKYFLWGPILALLDSRRTEVADIYESAEAARSAADTARKEYESRLAQADEESRQRIAEALAQANAMKEEIIANARQQSDRIISAGNESVRQEMEKAQVQIRDSATKMAVDLAGRIIQQNINAESQKSLIDRFIEGVGQPQ
jgi:F-type H+-transporting ATPase subunit b